MLRRIITATAVTGVVVTALTGCSGQQEAQSDCNALSSGALSSNTVVSGTFGETPTVEIPAGLSSDTTQRTVAIEGDDDGDRAVEGSLVGVRLTLFDVETGNQLYTSAATDVLQVSADNANALSEALRCSVPGDRIVLSVEPEESAEYTTQLGGTAGSAMLSVLDVESVSPSVLKGKTRGLPHGFPAVVTDEDGQSGVVLPPTEAPEGTTSAIRIEGDGEEVTADDSVIGRVLTVDWDGVERTNGMGGLGAESDGLSYRAELTGKKVGSQVVVIENTGDTATVSVIDILAVS